MNRNFINRFKFRAWSPQLATMTIPLEYNEEFITLQGAILMQSTGICDKNHKLIYEGDILLLPDILEDGNLPAAVVFKNGAFGVSISEATGGLYKRFYSFDEFDELFNEIADDCFKEIENIGNIFENPDKIPEKDVEYIQKKYFDLQ